MCVLFFIYGISDNQYGVHASSAVSDAREVVVDAVLLDYHKQTYVAFIIASREIIVRLTKTMALKRSMLISRAYIFSSSSTFFCFLCVFLMLAEEDDSNFSTISCTTHHEIILPHAWLYSPWRTCPPGQVVVNSLFHIALTYSEQKLTFFWFFLDLFLQLLVFWCAVNHVIRKACMHTRKWNCPIPFHQGGRGSTMFNSDGKWIHKCIYKSLMHSIVCFPCHSCIVHKHTTFRKNCGAKRNAHHSEKIFDTHFPFPFSCEFVDHGHGIEKENCNQEYESPVQPYLDKHETRLVTGNKK